ncbi:UDP-glucose 4-epimerase GalE [Quatrionicoccus australiensis]|uniref:UDP-glucose 4-epimerase GalE n=1 Tax=Quatrionicoccus australiensis TaxID=138118 RepID=UPI001CFB4957|nr:UDP-glucose 4-epimerase GalE [Quatrionicoccus australiensis]MCB4358664.1 UDP-glucose 4-epimerase GalE [Quatrionicoccus australiensis]
MRVLIVGGAGYIGSHMVWLLGEKGVELVTLDNLSGGYRDAVSYGNFVHGDISDRLILDQVFSDYKFDVVMHFASYIQVGESVRNPAKYYQNNVSNTLNLLNSMVAHGVNKFIFSSTAAIFGEPKYTPIDEGHPKQPINPYGRSKFMIEEVLSDYRNSYGLNSVCLRYFNAAGAHPDGMIGERHDPETHLIPLVLQAASGRRSGITLYGSDYDTPDGTCIRDYVHVMDLAEAHWLAIKYLFGGGESTAFNLGNGAGYSVNEVIKSAERITGRSISIIQGERRDGDPARLVADSSKIKAQLGWDPRFSDLDTIVKHAWNWEKNR